MISSTPTKPLKDGSAKKENRRSITKKKKPLLPQQKRKRKAKKNLWDEAMAANPDLAKFVNDFNESVDEATKKPLNITQ